MTTNSQRCDCGSADVNRLNPLGKIAVLECIRCKSVFIPWEDRKKVCIAIGNDKPALQLFETPGVINERILEFWARTDTKGTAGIMMRYIREHDSEFFRRMTAATTIDRDFRRRMDSNDDGLNKTYRKQATVRRPTGLEAFMP